MTDFSGLTTYRLKAYESKMSVWSSGVWHPCLSHAAVTFLLDLYDKMPWVYFPSPSVYNIWAMIHVWMVKVGDYQNYSVLYCVQQLCTVICSHIRAVL